MKLLNPLYLKVRSLLPPNSLHHLSHSLSQIKSLKLNLKLFFVNSLLRKVGSALHPKKQFRSISELEGEHSSPSLSECQGDAMQPVSDETSRGYLAKGRGRGRGRGRGKQGVKIYEDLIWSESFPIHKCQTEAVKKAIG